LQGSAVAVAAVAVLVLAVACHDGQSSVGWGFQLLAKSMVKRTSVVL